MNNRAPRVYHERPESTQHFYSGNNRPHNTLANNNYIKKSYESGKDIANTDVTNEVCVFHSLKTTPRDGHQGHPKISI